MESIGYNDIKITPIDVPSQVSSKPINEETLIGAQNRNKNLYKYCQENNTDFDLLISIEGGYEQVNNMYFIVTYASIIDNKNNDFLKKPGISLENINLEINISDLKLNHKIKNYLLFILNTYHKELNQTSFLQENMQKYKEKLIFEMEYKYIMDFLSYLNEDEIRKLLGNINNERFIEIINNINSKETKLERLLP